MNWIMLGPKKLEYYDGLLIMADTGLHNQVFSVVNEVKNKINNDNETHVLDVAAGQGAFSKRLYDNGFIVESIDIDRENFRYHGTIPFNKVDLNNEKNWSEFIQNNKGKYDIVVSMETIEHLENPWIFIRGLKELVKPMGYIVLSTPNIESPWSIFCFFFQNRFHGFTEDSLSYGHINPITSFELKTIISKIGLKEAATYPGGLYPVIWFKRDIINAIKWSFVNIFSLLFIEKLNYSWCKIYLMRK